MRKPRCAREVVPCQAGSSCTIQKQPCAFNKHQGDAAHQLIELLHARHRHLLLVRLEQLLEHLRAGSALLEVGLSIRLYSPATGNQTACDQRSQEGRFGAWMLSLGLKATSQWKVEVTTGL